jgi:hypothetical protein
MMVTKNDNLKDFIHFPLLRLVLGFKEALDREDFEVCANIKAEMDRRQKSTGINKRILKEILLLPEQFHDDDLSGNNEHFQAMFKNYL